MTDLPYERLADLRAVIGEHTTGEIQSLFVSILCDGCGKVISAPSAEELDVAGWKISTVLGGDDLCPDCAAPM